MSSTGVPKGLTATLARNIQTARLSSGYTQKTLAAALDVQSMAVSNWERGVHRASMDNLVVLSRLTGRDVGWFFVDHETKAAA